MARSRLLRLSQGLYEARWHLLGLALLLGSACKPAPAHVEVERNGTPFKGRWQLLCEHWTEPGLSELARQEGLFEVVADRSSELDAILRLTSWTSRLWPYGVPDPYPLSNAQDILTDIRAGRTSGFCGQYAYVLADALKAVGFFAVRYVEIVSRHGRPHFVVEVWSDEAQSWILLDPTLALYYTAPDGRPLSALDLHEIAVDQDWELARPMLLQPRPEDDRGLAKLPHHGVSLYWHVAFSLRSNYFNHPQPVTTAERHASFLYFADPDVEKHLDAYIPTTEDPADIGFPVNQVYLEPVSVDTTGALLHLSTRGTAPSFRHLEVRRGSGTWEVHSATTVRVEATPSGTRLEARAVNHAGHRGAISAAIVYGGG